MWSSSAGRSANSAPSSAILCSSTTAILRGRIDVLGLERGLDAPDGVATHGGEPCAAGHDGVEQALSLVLGLGQRLAFGVAASETRHLLGQSADAAHQFVAKLAHSGHVFLERLGLRSQGSVLVAQAACIRLRLLDFLTQGLDGAAQVLRFFCQRSLTGSGWSRSASSR